MFPISFPEWLASKNGHRVMRALKDPGLHEDALAIVWDAALEQAAAWCEEQAKIGFTPEHRVGIVANLESAANVIRYDKFVK